mgnify:CR=1 FL=1
MKMINILFIIPDHEKEEDFYDELPKERILKAGGRMYDNLIGIKGVMAIADAVDKMVDATFKDSVAILQAAGVANERNEILPEAMEDAKKEIREVLASHTASHKNDSSHWDENDLTIPPGTIIH